MDPTNLDMGMVNAPRHSVIQTDDDVHEQFSRTEYFQQLKAIDSANQNRKDITNLLEHTRLAVEALTKPAVHHNNDASATTTTQENVSEPTKPDFDAQAQFVQFKTAMYNFIATLDSVDKRLKRQMYGLEEAGILTLQRAAGGGGGGAGAAVVNGGGNTIAAAAAAGSGEKPGPSLDPDGMGRIGTLDVGRLNAGRATVECAMEAELWSRARSHLDRVVGNHQDGLGDEMVQ